MENQDLKTQIFKPASPQHVEIDIFPMWSVVLRVSVAFGGAVSTSLAWLYQDTTGSSELVPKRLSFCHREKVPQGQCAAFRHKLAQAGLCCS